MENRAKIHVAFRFHVNLYHSYRADTPDERGLGRDIRVMTYCLNLLDELNAAGIPVKGTWDIENYYSLQKNMAKLCPEITEHMKKRVQAGQDEVELMSYNNGIVSAHTEEEARAMIELAISNKDGSGLKDIFGTYAPIVRPQECMHTPSLTSIYKNAGVEAISIYYSCIPFNGFSSFVPLLSNYERYNPLWYQAPGSEEKIKLLPAINPGDHFEFGGITKLARRLRKEQLKMSEPKDMLIILDMDADDDFWQGYLNTRGAFALGIKKPPFKGGLNIIARKLHKLSYVQFTTPYEYLKTHEPVKTVSYGQDTADGCYDSFSPWTDKLENKKLWTAIERNKMTNDYAMAISDSESIRERVAENIMPRIRSLSTTHFGLSTPAMCKPRLEQAFKMVADEQEKSDGILKDAISLSKLDRKHNYAVFSSRYFKNEGERNALIRFEGKQQVFCAGATDGFVRKVFGKEETVLIYKGKDSVLPLDNAALPVSTRLMVSENSVGNQSTELKIVGNTLFAFYNGKPFLSEGSMDSFIKFDGIIYRAVEKEYQLLQEAENCAGFVERGRVPIPDTEGAKYTKTYRIFADLPYIYIDTEFDYPLTADYGNTKARTATLYRGYDTRWEEVAPLEIVPALRGSSQSPIRVYKHNFMGGVSYFDYDYYKYTPNKNLDAANNAVTCGFVSFSGKGEGLLVAQSAAADYLFAFMNTRFLREGDTDTLRLNPFGIYRGKQWKYNTTRLGFVAGAAMKLSESGKSCATTYRGGKQQFSLMLAPFDGEKPSDALMNDALAFAYPPYILSSGGELRTTEFTDFNTYEPIN